MASELQLSNTQVAAGPLVLDGETLTGIVVTTGYVFSSSHNLAAVTPYEVTPASEESRLTATAATILDEAETGWYVTVAGSTALDLSDVANRGGIAWFRPNNDYIGFSEDIGGTNAAYLPTWPDGLFFERIGSYDDLLGRTVAGVAFDGTGNVPTADLAAALKDPAVGDFVLYGVSSLHSSPGGDTNTPPTDGVGPWVTLPLDPTPMDGSTTVATINTTDHPGWVHYPVQAQYAVTVFVVTADTGTGPPAVAYDGRLADALNAIPYANPDDGTWTYTATKLVYAGPDSVDNELIYGTTDPSDLAGAIVQIVRLT